MCVCIYILYIAYTYITAYISLMTPRLFVSVYIVYNWENMLLLSCCISTRFLLQQMFKTYVVVILLYFRHCYWYNKCSKHMLLLSCCFSDTVTDITNVQNICCCFIRLCYKKTTHWQKHKLLLSCCLGFATVTMLLLGLLFYRTLLLIQIWHKLLLCCFFGL